MERTTTGAAARGVVAALLATTLLMACSDAPSGARGAPNVLFILADDLGYADLGSYGNTEIATPNLDRMAADGVRLTDFYAGSSVCTPSRMAFLTGRYPYRAVLDERGVFFPDSTGGLDPSEVTIAELLRDRGYATALIGKWHLGHLPQFLPNAQGFETFFGLPYSNDMDEPQYPGQVTPPHGCNDLVPGCRPGVPLMRDGKILETPAIQETLTQRYTEAAIAVMRDAVNQRRPFFVYYANNAPHTPLWASDAFRGRSRGGLYGDVVEEIDWSVGELLRAIRELGIDDDTLVVFSSDNGPWLLWATDTPQPQGGFDSGSAGTLRNGKSTTFEGGVRVPLIARWPGHVEGGRTITAPAAMIDWLPTFAALAGAPLPDEVTIDGRDILPLLDGSGARQNGGEFRMLYYRQDNTELAAYREGRWKLKRPVVGGESVYARFDHGELLFDLEADPGETRDLAEQMPMKADQLRRSMLELAADVHP